MPVFSISQELNPLGAHKQIAKYFNEYVPSRPLFQGSIVLSAQSGQSFVATALLQDHGIYCDPSDYALKGTQSLPEICYARTYTNEYRGFTLGSRVRL